MANFEAQVRTTFRDVAGLVLSLDRTSIVEDIANPGFIREWINRAPGLPSIPAVRQPGAPAPTYLGSRFPNPKNRDFATQPALILTGGGEQRARFDRARSTYLLTEALANSVIGNQPFACAYQFDKGADVSNGQAICAVDTSADFSVYRRNGAGDAEINAGGVSTVAGDHADGTFAFTGRGPVPGTAIWQRDGAAYGTGDGDVEVIASTEKLHVGRAPGPTDYLDGILDGIHLWACELSPQTLDFIWQTVNADAVDYSTQLRAPMSAPIWTDVTGDLSQNEIDRLNPIVGLPFRYVLVQLPAAPAPHRVQVAAAVNGVVAPDALLGGDLFIHNWIEVPGPPVVYPTLAAQDAGWSSVFDFNISREGHYTLGLTRDNGGTVIVHFDVQVAA